MIKNQNISKNKNNFKKHQNYEIIRNINKLLIDIY